MIFVTVGTQGAFDRLVDTVDAWAGEARRADVFAQIGPSKKTPQHIEWARELTPAQFNERLAAARIVVSHAGIGTIFSALHLRKPVLVMPRHASLGEQRNEHQLATVRRFAEMGIVTAAMDEQELRERLEHIDELVAAAPIDRFASKELIDRVRGFLDEALD